MRHQHRLGTLQVRVGRHRAFAGNVGLVDEFTSKLDQQIAYGINLLANIEPQIGGDLLVAAASRVQLVAGFASQFHQARLDVVVHILDRRIVGLGNRFARDLLEREDRAGKLLRIQHSGAGERGRVRLAGSDFVRQQHAIEGKRPLPLLEFGILRLAEAARPHLHLTVSAWIIARERAGRPRMRMKPSASFWL